MNSTLKQYTGYLTFIVGVPLLWYFGATAFGEQTTFIAMFKLGLLIGLYMLACRGLASYFPKENLATRSLARLIEQNVLLGLLFGAFITLMKEFVLTTPTQSDGMLIVSFCIAALFFGGGMLGAALIEQRNLNQSSISTK